MNIYEKLIEVRKAVPYLQKTNSGAQYKYVGSSDVLGALRKAMDEHKLLVIPRVMRTNVITNEGENQRGGKTTKYFTEAWMEYTIVNAEKPDEAITIPWYAQGLDTEGEKGVGKYLTYAEKYLFLKLFNIATDKDDPDAFQEANGLKEKEPAPKQESKKPDPPKPAQQPPAKPSAPAPKPAEKPASDGKGPDWTSFWKGARSLGLSTDYVHTEASSFFGCGAVKSLSEVPDLDNTMLTQFAEYLRTTQKGA